MTPKEVMALCRKKDVKSVDLRFTDLLGTWQHFSIPIDKLNEDLFEDGLGFDGSCIIGWQAIHESDLIAVPQPETAFLDPFSAIPTMVLICIIQDPITRDEYSIDPRTIAIRATNFLANTGIADTAFFGPEAEFYVFDDSQNGPNPPNSGLRIRKTEDLFSSQKLNDDYDQHYAPLNDRFMDLRKKMMQTMMECGLNVESQHHKVGTTGQVAIDLRYLPLVAMADAMMTYKYIVKGVARENNLLATFMPKPIFGESGSGMHVHFSLWKEDNPIFAGTKYAGLSDTALHAIGGILRHAPALMAFTNPTTNSYKRLLPGFQAPVNLTYSQRNRSAACRVPMYDQSPQAKRMEFRFPDPSCNPYLAFSAMLMAAIDGIQNKFDPGEPSDLDNYAVDSEYAKTPISLGHALSALEQDHEFLLRGDVFSMPVIETWIEHKKTNEVQQLRSRPHPFEFYLYFDQ